MTDQQAIIDGLYQIIESQKQTTLAILKRLEASETPTLRLITNDDPPKGKFVAFWSDGSGAKLFHLTRSGLIKSNGDFCEEDDFVGVFLNRGYVWWMPLPDSFKLFYELTGEDE